MYSFVNFYRYIKYIGRTDGDAEAPIPDANSSLI